MELHVLVDTVLHFVLGLGIMLSVFGLLRFCGVGGGRRLYAACAFISAGVLYFREVTQEQTKHYGSHFFAGWSPEAWGNGKLIEAVVPAAVFVGFGLWSLYTTYKEERRVRTIDQVYGDR